MATNPGRLQNKASCGPSSTTFALRGLGRARPLGQHVRVLPGLGCGVDDGIGHGYRVSGGAPIQFAATDGFNDPGMHAAYRTGQAKPWTIEVFEAPSEDSAAGEFKKLFEMNIASDRR